MKVKKVESLNGDFAKKKEDINDGDLITILDEGKVIEGVFGEQRIFKIKTKAGDEKLLSFNQTSINHLIDTYEDETKDWVGKEAKIWIVKQNVAGKFKDVVYLTGPKGMLEDPTDDDEEVPFW